VRAKKFSLPVPAPALWVLDIDGVVYYHKIKTPTAVNGRGHLLLIMHTGRMFAL